MNKQTEKKMESLKRKAVEVAANCGIGAEVEVGADGVPFLKLERKFKIEDGILVAKVAGSKGMEYQIRKQMPGSWTCSCPAYRYSRGEVGKKFPCKHIRGLWKAWREQKLVAGMMILAPQAL